MKYARWFWRYYRHHKRALTLLLTLSLVVSALMVIQPVLLKNIFDAKEVPLPLIGKIAQYREYHRLDFTSVEAAVKPNIELNTFDFYFDYVVDRCKCLKSLWEM